jgi:electron transport complex protein RnfG
MPEQDNERLPGQWTGSAEEAEHIGAEAEASAGGAAEISPLIIVPPVAIAAVMGLLLALVYGVTKEPIAAAKRLDKQQKLEQVMPAFDNDPLTTESTLSEEVTAYTGLKDEQVTGFGLTSAVKTGYGGYFSIVFGINPDDTLSRVRILESAETPGLGSKAANPPFIDQFDGKPLDFDFRVTKDGGGVDAITGATITSRAVCKALSQGIEAYNTAGGNTGLAPEQAEQATDEQQAAPDWSSDTFPDPHWNQPGTESPDGEGPPDEEEPAAGDDQQEEVADDGE